VKINALSIAILCGIAVGLIVKYFLDKRWIFFDYRRGLKNHIRKFSLYTTGGALTTLIFWATEVVV